MDLINTKYVVNSLLFSGIGIGVLILSFVLIDLCTPKVRIWRELVEKQNVALGVFFGAVAIGVSIIIASAIHG